MNTQTPPKVAETTRPFRVSQPALTFASQIKSEKKSLAYGRQTASKERNK